MNQQSHKILLNEILRIDDIDNVKIRFNLMFQGVWNPLEFFKNGDLETMLNGQYWNYSTKKSFKEGQSTIVGNGK